MRHEHWNGEALLEWVLAPDESRRAELEACGRCRAELEALSSVVGRCRELLAPVPTERETRSAAALSERILARTTREDLSVRGDFELLTDFLRRRLKASPLLRVLAASLLIHIAALPVLAYYQFFRAEEPGFNIRVESAQPAPFDPEPAVEPQEQVEWDEVVELPEAVAIDESALEADVGHANARRWARYHLVQGAPTGSLAEARHGVTRLLALRSNVIRSDAPPAGFEHGTSEVERALWLELLLDRFVLERRVPRGLSVAIEAIVASSSDDVLLVQWRSLARAEAYGLLADSETDRMRRWRERLQAADKSIGSADPELLLPGAPLERGWIEALRRAAPGVLEGDAVGRAWLAWELPSTGK